MLDRQIYLHAVCKGNLIEKKSIKKNEKIDNSKKIHFILKG